MRFGGDLTPLPLSSSSFSVSQWSSAIPSQLRLSLKLSPIEQMKSIKNSSEQLGMISCHLRDGAAYSHLLWKLFQTPSKQINEVEIANALCSLRRQYSPDSYLYPSFETIAGIGPNGAIVHYRCLRSIGPFISSLHRAKSETSRLLTRDEILLLDSGGQYLDGTTDLTRTIHLGDPTPYQVYLSSLSVSVSVTQL
jgi:Xaa-Pro aminopeptidase